MNAGLSRTARNLAGDMSLMWQNTRVRTVLQVLFLLGMGALATYAKSISIPLGIPGHSAVLWLGVLVAGRTLVNRSGAGFLMGASIALWVVPMSGWRMPDGLATNGIIYNFGLYGGTGLALDLAARIPKMNIRHPLGALACGVLALSAKFGFTMLTTYLNPVVRNFVLLGVAKSFGLHILFGAMAGLLGWGAYYVSHPKKRTDASPPNLK